jgi:DNA-binding NarL/FixJ family response regulator
MFICPYGTSISTLRWAVRRLRREGYHVVAYETATAVFMAGDPAILRDLISAMRKDIESQISRLRSEGVTEFGFFGSSLGSFVFYNCIGEALPELRWGVFNTGGDIAQGMWRLDRARRQHVLRGWSLPRLEAAWADLQWPRFGRLDGCRFAFVSSRRDTIAPRHRRRPRRGHPRAGRRPARAGRTDAHRRRPPDHRQPGRRPHLGDRRTAVARLKAPVMRIVIAEDAAVIRAGLAEILADRGHELAAAVGDAEALKTAVAEHNPDVAIVDVRMPPDYTDEGLRAAIAIRRDHPGTGILVFSQYVETRYAADLLRMRSGGVGYLLKDRVANVGEFVDAIARVAAGGTAFDPEVVSGMLNASRHASVLAALTARERDVLALMAEGRSNGAIAAHLVVSERAVEKHISNIFSKLGLPPSDSDHRRVLAVLAYLGS